MKKVFIRSVLASAVAAAAFAAPAGASAGPNNTLDGCSATANSGSGANCIWYADVNGEYGGAVAGSYYVLKYVGSGFPATGAGLCSATVTTACWSVVASGGAGPFAASPGTTPLTAGSYYSLAVSSGGGAMGSITGQGTI